MSCRAIRRHTKLHNQRIGHLGEGEGGEGITHESTTPSKRPELNVFFIILHAAGIRTGYW